MNFSLTWEMSLISFWRKMTKKVNLIRFCHWTDGSIGFASALWDSKQTVFSIKWSYTDESWYSIFNKLCQWNDSHRWVIILLGMSRCRQYFIIYSLVHRHRHSIQFLSIGLNNYFDCGWFSRTNYSSFESFIKIKPLNSKWD